MKKNIGFVYLDSSLARWLCEKLRISPPETPTEKELVESVENLMDGTVNSLMVEL